VEDVEARLDILFDAAMQHYGNGLRQRPQCLGDSGLVVSQNIMTPFGYDPNAAADDALRIHDQILSMCHVPNEWGFGRVVNSFQTLQFKRLLLTSWTKPEQSYLVAILLINLLVCHYGAQHECYFGISAPDFEEYLNEITHN
jgi:hypothetical protein